jgi:hypothetical protein
MKIRKNYIVQVEDTPGRWLQSLNEGAEGTYTKASAIERAKKQEKKNPDYKYRAKEIK